MRIRMLIDSLGPGGAQRQFIKLANGLAAEGHEVKVRFYHEVPRLAEALSPEVDPGFISSRLPFLRKLRALFFMAPWAKVVCVSFLTTPNRINCLARLLSPWPRRVVSERSIDHAPVDVGRWLTQLLYVLAGAVVCNSRTQAAQLARRPWLARKVRYVGNCVDLEKFRPLPAPPRAVDDEGLRGIVVANFKPAKNPLFLIRALDSPVATGVTVDWYGQDADSGDGESTQSKSARLLRTLGHGRMRIAGGAAHPESLYPGYDFLCLPSLYEGMPNVVAEAMACGLPVLCSRVSDNALLVEEGVNGFLFDPTSEPEFLSALARLRQLQPSERAEMGRRNRKKAEELFGYDAYLGAWLRMIKPGNLA